jgi:hypothetical protein
MARSAARANEEIVAFCDVDWRELGGRSAGEIAKKHPKVPKFTDFREMLDKKGGEIDAVLISTPDHIHFAAAMAAMEAKKHIFVQKPLAHNIWQVRTLQKAAKKYGVQTVMGNQGPLLGRHPPREGVVRGRRARRGERSALLDGSSARATSVSSIRRLRSPPKTEPVPEGLSLGFVAGSRGHRVIQLGVSAAVLARLVGLWLRRAGRHRLPLP